MTRKGNIFHISLTKKKDFFKEKNFRRLNVRHFWISSSFTGWEQKPDNTKDHFGN